MSWSYYYMGSESFYRGFVTLVFFFLFSMRLLVISGNLIILLVSWDLLGFSSLFLVFYTRTRGAVSAGILTGLVNRLGDCFFYLVLGLSTFTSSSLLAATILLLFFVSMTKSAMVPFSAWLPSAIVAPTPVSALVHSSTLVTAGVYLLYRFIRSESPFLLTTGILTSLVGGLAAALEVDVKRIVAFSTLSQLGVIFVGLGLGKRSLRFFHLNCHAMFKALLFISVGVLIHSCYGSQEGRSLLILPYCSPWSLLCIVVSSLSMCGCVFLSGWATKDAVFEAMFNWRIPCASLFLFYICIGLTIVYSCRLTLLAVGFQSSFPVIVSSTPASILLLFPTISLLLFGVMEGLCLVSCAAKDLAALAFWEKLRVYFLFLITPYLSILLNQSARPNISRVTPYSVLCRACSSSITRISLCYYLESSSIQSFGVSKAPTVLNLPTRIGMLTAKVFLFLGCVLVLI